MSSSWNSWVGKICQKLEGVCLDVEDIITKEHFDYVQTQIQSAGANVRQFCSEIIDDVIDIDRSSVDSANEEDIGSSLIPNTDSPPCETSKGAVDSCLVQNTESPPCEYSTTKGAVDLSLVKNTESPPSGNSTVERFVDPSLVQNTEYPPCENSTIERAVDTSFAHYLESQPTENSITNGNSEYTLKPVEEGEQKSSSEQNISTGMVKNFELALVEDHVEEEQLNNRSDDFTRQEKKDEADDKVSVKLQMENLPPVEEYCIPMYSVKDMFIPRDMEEDPETMALMKEQMEDIQRLKEYCMAMEEADTEALMKQQLEEIRLLNESFIFTEGNKDNSGFHKRNKLESSNLDVAFSDSEWEFV